MFVIFERAFVLGAIHNVRTQNVRIVLTPSPCTHAVRLAMYPPCAYVLYGWPLKTHFLRQRVRRGVLVVFQFHFDCYDTDVADMCSDRPPRLHLLRRHSRRHTYCAQRTQK